MLEIACFDKYSAIIAADNGADRIEFCADLESGGTTPSIKDFLEIKQNISIPIYIMIRPRGGDFCYSAEEFSIMEAQILEFKKYGADGFVFGILTSQNTIDIKKNKVLVNLSHPAPCSIHRAFDRVSDMEKSLEDVIACGFKVVLTSGLKPNVTEGKDNLKKLVSLAYNRIEILCGGGLRSTNIAEIKNHTMAKHFHSSGIINETKIADAKEIQNLKNILLS